MRYLSALALMAVAVFLFSTSSTEVFAKRPSNPPELEQRVSDLETRMDGAESTNTTQDARLNTLELNQSNLQTDVVGLENNDAAQDSQLTDHGARIIDLEQHQELAISTEEKLRIVRGYVGNVSGSYGHPMAGQGFTSLRTAPGKYTVTLDTPFPISSGEAIVPVVTVLEEDDARFAVISDITDDASSVNIFGHDGSPVDGEFFFILIGPG